MGLEQYIKTLNPKRKFMDIANSYGGLDLIDYIHATEGFIDSLGVKTINGGNADFYILSSNDFTSETANITTLSSNLIKFKDNSYTLNDYFVGLKSGSLNISTIYTLPLEDGESGQSLMTNGAGILYWDTAAGSGDVTGPSFSTDNAIALWSGTSGSVLKNSNVLIDFTGNIHTNGNVTANEYIIQNNFKLVFSQNITQTSDIFLVFPDNYGQPNQVMTTDGAGYLSWTSIGGGGGGAPNDAKYIIQTPSAGLPNAQVLSTLPGGIVFNETNTGILSTKTKIDLSNLPSLGTTYVPDLGGFAPQIYAGTENGDVEVSNQLGVIMGDLELLNIWKLTGAFIVAKGIPGFSFPSGQRLEELTRGGLLRTTRAGDVSTPTQPAGAGFLRTASPGVDYLDGPSSSTDNAVVLWDGTNGMKIKNSNVIIDANANITGVRSISCSDKLRGSKLELTNTSGGTSSFKAANQLLNLLWTLPQTLGSANQVLTLSDDIGNLTWGNNGSGDVKRIGDTLNNHIVLWSGNNESNIKNSTAIIDEQGNLTINGDTASNNLISQNNLTAKNLILTNLANLTFTPGNNNTNITLEFPNTGGADGDVLTREGTVIGNTYKLKWGNAGNGDLRLEGSAISNNVAIFGSTEHQIKDSGVNISTIKGYADSARESAESAAASAEEASVSALAAEGSAAAAAASAIAAEGSATAAGGAAIAAAASAIAAGIDAALAGTRADNAKNSADNAKNSADNAKNSADNAANSAQEAQNALDGFLNTDLVFTGEITGSGNPKNNINLNLNTTNNPLNNQFLQAAVNGSLISLRWANGGGGGSIIGPSTSKLNSVAIWNDLTGGELKDSNIFIDNDNISTQGDIFVSNLILRAVKNLTLKANQNMFEDFDFIFPPNKGLPGQVLTSDGIGGTYWSDGGSSNYVIGPLNSTLNAFAVYGSINGAILLNSNITFNGNVLNTNRTKAARIIFH